MNAITDLEPSRSHVTDSFAESVSAYAKLMEARQAILWQHDELLRVMGVPSPTLEDIATARMECLRQARTTLT